MKYLILLFLTSCASSYGVVQQRSPALEYLMDDISYYRGQEPSKELDRQPEKRYYDSEMIDFDFGFIRFNNGGY